MIYRDDDLNNLCKDKKQEEMPKYFKIYDRKLDREIKEYIVKYNLKKSFYNKKMNNEARGFFRTIYDDYYEITNNIQIEAYISFLYERFNFKDSYLSNTLVTCYIVNSPCIIGMN